MESNISPSLLEQIRAPELQRVLNRVIEELMVVVAAQNCYMYLAVPDQTFVPFLVARPQPTAEVHAFLNNVLHPSTDLLLDSLLADMRGLLSNQVAADIRLNPSILNQLNADAVLAVPLVSDGGMLGLLLCTRRVQDGPFGLRDLHMAESISAAVTLSVENARLYQETHNRLLESQSLHQITLALLQKLELPEVLEIVCGEAQRLTQAQGSAVALLEDENWLRVMYCAGDTMHAPGRFSIDQSLLGLAVRRGEPVLINNRSAHGHDAQVGGPISLLALPLKVQGKIIGVLDVVNKRHGFTTEDVRLIQLYADQAAVAVEHARLSRAVQDMRLVEERQRLSRELHDSVNQLLYGIALYGEAAQRKLAAGDTAAALRHLENVCSSAEQALSEMRLLIFDLRPQILEQKGLQAALAQRLKSVEERLGLESVFKWRVSAPLDARVEEALYGIAQEALNNVIKHSRARNVSVHLVQSGHALILKVEDDGVGFDVQQIGEGGLGLKSIQERAASLNARLTIDSLPGRGTQIVVEVTV